MENWFAAPLSTILITGISVCLIFLVIIAITRLAGLRTFAKMSSFDFASTIAVGSILASVVMNTDQSLIKGSVALASIILLQTVFSVLKRRYPFFRKLAQNDPVLLMRDGIFLDENLEKAKVSKEDVIAKLRETNAYRLEDVKAVVFETTGDISVLHGDGEIDSELLDDVKA